MFRKQFVWVDLICCVGTKGGSRTITFLSLFCHDGCFVVVELRPPENLLENIHCSS